MRLDRLNQMENYIIHNGLTSIEDLAKKFEVSIHTVRRDLGEIMQRGNIEKAYGGVFAINKNIQSISVRTEKYPDAKKKIGKLASTLIKPHKSLFLDSGSTVSTILPYLAQASDVTIITHSLITMYEASKYPSLKIIALGGLYNSDTASYIAVSGQEILSRFSIDMALIAATGISLESGLTDNVYMEAEIKRAAIKCSKRIVLMADHSKFDKTALTSYLRLEDLDVLVTDKKPSEKYMQFMQNNNIDLLYEKSQ